MVLMNGDKSIAVIDEDGTQVKTVPNNWEPGAPLDNPPSKSEEKQAAPEPAQEPQQKEEPKPESEPIPSQEEQKPVEPTTPEVQILEEPLDLAKGVPEGFIPKNAVGVILAG
jgi:pyruvate/2-oxoglutarate dehydrogenase complex dihydrolipoamide acyltransferase (E2) component